MASGLDSMASDFGLRISLALRDTPRVSSSPVFALVTLPNGVRSVRSLAHAETFHPVIGPVAEAEALYLRQLRLVERMREHEGEFVIWDVGLGAAANALTVLRGAAAVSTSLRIHSFDCTLEPLQFAFGHQKELGYYDGYGDVLARLAEQKRMVFANPGGSAGGTVTWELHVADFPSFMAESAAERLERPHAILFDAYSPAKNPAMWTQPLFARMFALLDPGRSCALATYSRSTMLRVTLLLAGFFVGAGGATGEKEETTIAANSLSLIDAPLDRRWLERARRSNSAEPLWEPVYRQAPLAEATSERLRAHPQFG